MQMCPFTARRSTQRRGAAPFPPGQGFATSSGKMLSSRSSAWLLRVLIRRPISAQGQFDLHTHSARNWREPI